METANLCKCNNCDSILIDQNPKIGAKEHALTGNELEMQFMQGLVEHSEDGLFWACPTCLTDAYLTDL